MKKKVVLCLHGYSMSAEWMAEWCKPFELLLPDFEFVIPNAPNVAPEEEVKAMWERFNAPLPEGRIGVGKNWCWYRATDDKPPSYLQVEDSFHMLEALFQQHGPVEGVLGWSQGTVMAAILAALQEKLGDKRFQFKWGVFCGGFRPGDPRFKQHFDEVLSLPSLHVIGERESAFMLEQGQKLADSFVDSEILKTPVGHIMPIKYPSYMEKIASWIARASQRG